MKDHRFGAAKSERQGPGFVMISLFAALFLGIYWPVMRVEEGHLAELFGDDYRRYADSVPLFAPRLSPYSDALKARFDASLYWRYREYQAGLGVMAALAVLAAKALFLK